MSTQYGMTPHVVVILIVFNQRPNSCNRHNKNNDIKTTTTNTTLISQVKRCGSTTGYVVVGQVQKQARMRKQMCNNTLTGIHMIHVHVCVCVCVK